ncbi:hypothetical protein SB769_36395, partial [Burkholderia sp. SIMBA_024]
MALPPRGRRRAAPPPRRQLATAREADALGGLKHGRDPRSRATAASALIGASRPEQLDENIAAVNGPALTAEELARIDELAGS